MQPEVSAVEVEYTGIDFSAMKASMAMAITELEKYVLDDYHDEHIELLLAILEPVVALLQRRERNLTALEAQTKSRLEHVQRIENELQDYRDEKFNLQSDIHTLKQQLEREQNSQEKAKHQVKQEIKKREDLTNTVNQTLDSAKDNALANMKLFVRMWKDEILTLKLPDKLRCIIPWDTTTWFKTNYYQLDGAAWQT